jgi:hypothetical protein
MKPFVDSYFSYVFTMPWVESGFPPFLCYGCFKIENSYSSVLRNNPETLLVATCFFFSVLISYIPMKDFLLFYHLHSIFPCLSLLSNCFPQLNSSISYWVFPFYHFIFNTQAIFILCPLYFILFLKMDAMLSLISLMILMAVSLFPPFIKIFFFQVAIYFFSLFYSYLSYWNFSLHIR